jgi:hypothetical protein
MPKFNAASLRAADIPRLFLESQRLHDPERYRLPKNLVGFIQPFGSDDAGPVPSRLGGLAAPAKSLCIST